MPLLCPCSLPALTPLPCHLPSVPPSTFPVSTDSSAFVLPVSQGYLWWVLEGLQGADKWEFCLPVSTHSMQKSFSTSAGHVAACSGSFVLVTFSQLNENPPQRLMQPEAIWELQAHLLSSLSHLPTILQSWQEGNKGSRILLSDPLSQGSLLTSYSISHFLMAVFRGLLSPSILFFPRFFAGRWDLPLLYCLFLQPVPLLPGLSPTVSISVSPSPHCVSHSPHVCVPQSLSVSHIPLPSLLRFTAQFAASTGSSLYFQLCTNRSGVPLEGTVHQEVLDPKVAFIWFGFIVLKMWLVHPYYLFSSLQLISGNFLNNISELRLVSAGWF